MKGELKAGGLALVLGDNEHTGKCVALVELVHPKRSFKNPVTGDVQYIHYSVTHPCWLVIGNVWTRSFKERGWALFMPSLLMPIDESDPDAIDEFSKEEPVELTA